MTRAIDGIVARGEVGGRTAQIARTGDVECVTSIFPRRTLVRVTYACGRVRTAVSPGTEMTFLGGDASNVYLHKHWNEDLRLFEAGEPSTSSIH